VSAPEPGRNSFRIRCDEANSLRDIRRWLRLNLPADTDLSYDAELVCTELVTNAIEHSRATCSVRIDIEDGCVHIEVDDDSPKPSSSSGDPRSVRAVAGGWRSSTPCPRGGYGEHGQGRPSGLSYGRTCRIRAEASRAEAASTASSQLRPGV
jgi:hypothetical protein